MSLGTPERKPSVLRALFAALLVLVTVVGIVFFAALGFWLFVLSGIWQAGTA
jgi:hypothetical protein